MDTQTELRRDPHCAESLAWSTTSTARPRPTTTAEHDEYCRSSSAPTSPPDNHRPIVRKARGGCWRRVGRRPVRDGASWRWARTPWSRTCPGKASNYEDAIIVSERVVSEDHTSPSTSAAELDARTRSWARRRSPAKPEHLRRHDRRPDADGNIRVGAEVPGDVLVGKVTLKSETELTARH